LRGRQEQLFCTCTLFKITFLGKWDERGERPFLWPLTSFPDRHTYSVHSAQYYLSSCFEQFCWDLVIVLPTNFRRFRLQQKCNRSTDMNRSEAATVVFGYQSSIESRKPLSTYSVIDAGRIVWTAESMERSGVRPSVRPSVCLSYRSTAATAAGEFATGHPADRRYQ